MASVKFPGLTLADAVEFVGSADEKFALGRGNRSADLIVLLVSHRRLVEQPELLGRRDDKDLAAKVLKMDFAVRTSRGGLDLNPAFQIADPVGLACGRVHPRNRPALAVEHIKSALVKQRGGDIRGHFAFLAFP